MKESLFPTQNGLITQKFGENADFYFQRFGIKGGHNGIDIVEGHGTPIYSSQNGTVCRVYDMEHGSVTAGFGVYVLGESDENGICDVFIYWHTMSNIPVTLGQKVQMGDVIAYMGDSGQVYTNMVAVPDSEKGIPPYPGTHLHWGKFQVKMTNTINDVDGGKIVLTKNDGTAYQDELGNYYEWLNFENGMHGCVDPLLAPIIYYNQFIARKAAQISEQAANIIEKAPEEEVSKEQKITLLQKIINFLFGFLKK